METKEFSQVCVWPGCIVGKDNISDFEKTMLETFGARVKYIEEITTLPDKVNGVEVPDTGGRVDLLFYVHNDDIPKFAIPRLMVGIRWIEDVLDNMGDNIIYPEMEKLNLLRTW